MVSAGHFTVAKENNFEKVLLLFLNSVGYPDFDAN